MLYMIPRNLVTDDADDNFLDNGNYDDWKTTMDVEEKSLFKDELYLCDNEVTAFGIHYSWSGDCICYS